VFYRLQPDGAYAVRKGGTVKPQGLRGIDVARAVKRYAKAAGLDAKEFSGHSLRAGFVTSAAETGASIQEVSRHKSVDVLSGYVRRVDLFKDHAGRASSDGRSTPPGLPRCANAASGCATNNRQLLVHHPTKVH
jgi:hypothetical protein